MNNITILGRMVRCPELKYSSGNDPIAITRFCIAVDKKIKKDNDNANFINCVAFGRTAENINKFFTKGTLICVSGSLEQNNYVDKDGNKRTNFEVHINNFSFCGSGNGKQSGEIEDFSLPTTSVDNSPF